MDRRSYRVKFTGGSGFELAGIVDQASTPTTVAKAQHGEAPVPVVVFSHCFTCNKDLKAIVRISRSLADAGITVLRYDMTGLGGSGGQFSDTNFTTNLADLAAAIGFAQATIGPVQSLIGHSFGGAASMAYAGGHDAGLRAGDSQAAAGSRLPTTVRSVITLASPSDTSHLADLLEKMNPAIKSVGAGDVVIGGFRWTIKLQMTDDFRRHRIADSITAIDLPVLIFHSPADQTVKYEHALRIQALLGATPTSDATGSLITLPGSDHLLSDSRDLEFVSATIASFIWRHSIAGLLL